MWFDEDFKQELKKQAELDQVITGLEHRLRKVTITNIILIVMVMVALATALIIAM